MGPVQVLVVGFDDPKFSGEVLTEFARLREAGIVRLLDLLLVERAEDGSFDTLDPPAELGSNSGVLAAAILGQPDAVAGAQAAGADDESADVSSWSLADAVPAGSVAAVALIEHTWATPLLVCDSPGRRYTARGSVAGCSRPLSDRSPHCPIGGIKSTITLVYGQPVLRTPVLIHSRKWTTLWCVPTNSDFEGMLRGAALRVTRPRVAVLTAVHAHPHADTDSIIGAVREDLGEVSHQAVYDVLRALTAADLVRRIQPTGSVARYEDRVGDNHHHLICRTCGRMVDVDCAVGDTPCLTAADDSGYEIDEAEVIYWGRCPECVAAASAASGG